MFVCTDSSGIRTYQNSEGDENCKPLELNPITVVPAAKPADFGDAMSKASKGPDPELESPYDFDPQSDRLRIIKEELRLEVSKLDSLKAEYNDGNPERLGSEKNYQKYLDRKVRLERDIKLTEDSIRILKREIESQL